MDELYNECRPFSLIIAGKFKINYHLIEILKSKLNETTVKAIRIQNFFLDYTFKLQSLFFQKSGFRHEMSEWWQQWILEPQFPIALKQLLYLSV